MAEAGEEEGVAGDFLVGDDAADDGGEAGEDSDGDEAGGEGDDAEGEGSFGQAGAGGLGVVVEGGCGLRHGVLLWVRGEGQEWYEGGAWKVREKMWGEDGEGYWSHIW